MSQACSVRVDALQCESPLFGSTLRSSTTDAPGATEYAGHRSITMSPFDDGRFVDHEQNIVSFINEY